MKVDNAEIAICRINLRDEDNYDFCDTVIRIRLRTMSQKDEFDEYYYIDADDFICECDAKVYMSLDEYIQGVWADDKGVKILSIEEPDK